MRKKKLISYLTILVLLFNVVFVNGFKVHATGTASITYALSNSNIKVGDSFDITVNCSNAADLYGAAIALKFDPTIMQITGVSQGNIFNGSGKTILAPVDNANGDSATVNSTGLLNFGLLIKGQVPGVSTNGSLFIIHAKALKVGSIALNTISDSSDLSTTGNNVCVKLSDSTGEPIGYGAGSGSIEITQAILPNDSVITSDTIPTSMVAGQSYNVSVTVKNTGSNTWTADNKYRLGLAGASTSFANFARVFLSTSDSIVPGTTKTFSFTLTAPVTSGSYTLPVQMVQDGVAWFGNIISKQIVVSTLPNNATIVSDTIPTSMVAGQPYNVSVTVKNTGSNTWTADNKYRLGLADASTSFANFARVLLSTSDSIDSGATKTFSFTLTAPVTSGSYTLPVQMVQDGVAWFGNIISKQIVVSTLPNNATIVSDTIPTSMVAGQPYNISVTVRNTGSNTWTADNKYRLGLAGASTSFANFARVFLSTSDSIDSGATKTFSFTLTAPVTSGSYTLPVQMVQEGVAWFGNIISKQIVVSTLPNNATIVSDTIPTSMVAGQPYNVSVTVKNTGSNTWTADNKYRLGLADSSTSFANFARVFLSSSDPIVPGATKTFSFTLTAPVTSGSYKLSMQMVQEGVAWFGDNIAKQIVVSTSPNNATIVSDTIPTSMVAGQSYNVSVTVKNTGSNTWTADNKYRLGLADASTSFANFARVFLSSSDSIVPCATKTFSFTLTAPVTSGSYKLSIQMVQEGVAWFGDNIAKQIVVSTSPNNATIVSDTIPTSMMAGQSYNVSVTVRNTGSNTWTADNKYRLGLAGASTSFANFARVFLSTSDSIDPGATKTFSFTLTAPVTSGSYKLSIQMVQEGVAWFGDNIDRSITVN